MARSKNKFLAAGVLAICISLATVTNLMAGTVSVNHGPGSTPSISIDSLTTDKDVYVIGPGIAPTIGNYALEYRPSQALVAGNFVQVQFSGAAFNGAAISACAITGGNLITQAFPVAGAANYNFQLQSGIGAGNTVYFTDAGCNAANSKRFPVRLLAATTPKTATVSINAMSSGGILIDPSAAANLVTITPGSSSQLVADPSSYNFGSLNVGDTSAAKMFVIVNTGAANVTIGSLLSGPALTGTDYTDFGFNGASNCSGANLAPGGTCTASIVFKPLTAGAKNATLSIHTVSSVLPLEIPLSGTGIQAYTLSVTATGTGVGTVTSNPPGILCGNSGGASNVCSAAYNGGASVILGAVAAENSTFGGWSGACVGNANPCSLIMDGAKNVTATFNSAASNCAYTATPSNNTFGGSGGTGTIKVTPSSAACNAQWYATSDVPWITFSYTCASGTCNNTTVGGNGEGTVAFNIAVNTETAARTGNITVAGNAIAVIQEKSCTTCGIVFGDVLSSDWAYSDISAIACAGITQGCGSGNYCPGDNVTRAQMAAFIVRAKVGESPSDYCSGGTIFSDVSSSDGFCKYIKRLGELQITQGCGGGKYCPSDYVTRGQMAAFIIRALYGENFSFTTTPHFSDVPTTNNYFKYVQKLKDDGITTTTGVYDVDSYVTRDQMAAFLYRAFLKNSCGSSPEAEG